MLAAADAGQTVVAAILGLAAAGVAGGVIAMAWSLHLHQIQLALREAGKPTEPSNDTMPVHAMNGNGNGNGNGGQTIAGGARVAADNGVAYPVGVSGAPRAAPAPRPAPPTAIEGPDALVIGERARYQVRRSDTQQVVSWAVGGGAASQASDPAHPDDLLLVADRPGNLTVSVRLREGLAERRETKDVTAVANPAAAAPAIAVAAAASGLAGHHGRSPRRRVRRALVAVGSLPVGDFIALVAPLTAVLAVVAATRGTGGRPGR